MGFDLGGNNATLFQTLCQATRRVRALGARALMRRRTTTKFKVLFNAASFYFIFKSVNQTCSTVLIKRSKAPNKMLGAIGKTWVDNRIVESSYHIVQCIVLHSTSKRLRKKVASMTQ